MNDFNSHMLNIEKKITEEIIKQFEKQTINEVEMATIATFILERFEKITNHEELVVFMNELSQKWVFFQNLAVIENGEGDKNMEQLAAKEALRLLQSGQAGKAALVAGTANE